MSNLETLADELTQQIKNRRGDLGGYDSLCFTLAISTDEVFREGVIFNIHGQVLIGVESKDGKTLCIRLTEEQLEKLVEIGNS